MSNIQQSVNSILTTGAALKALGEKRELKRAEEEIKKQKKQHEEEIKRSKENIEEL